MKIKKSEERPEGGVVKPQGGAIWDEEFINQRARMEDLPYLNQARVYGDAIGGERRITAEDLRRFLNAVDANVNVRRRGG